MLNVTLVIGFTLSTTVSILKLSVWDWIFEVSISYYYMFEPTFRWVFKIIWLRVWRLTRVSGQHYHKVTNITVHFRNISKLDLCGFSWSGYSPKRGVQVGVLIGDKCVCSDVVVHLFELKVFMNVGKTVLCNWLHGAIFEVSFESIYIERNVVFLGNNVAVWAAI